MKTHVLTGLTGAALVSTALLLTACGGGGGDGAPAPDEGQTVPASASESSSALMAFIKTLVGATSDTSEPLSLAGFDPVRPDDTEPEAVD